MSASLPHRSVANIRGAAPTSSSRSGSSHRERESSSHRDRGDRERERGDRDHSGTSAPARPIPTFNTPSSLRAEEELIVVDFGTRKIQVGFAGDSAPRGIVWFGPEQQRRIGDFRDWQTDYHQDWRSKAAGGNWGRDYELWRPDVRGLELGQVGDKVEKAVREAYTKYMLIDSRPRRMVCVVPTGLPIPLLSAALDSLFHRFQPPTVSLLSSPVAVAVAAGVRSALVVDLGWNETIVTSVYEYREVATKRTVRGGRRLTEETHRFLAKELGHVQRDNRDDKQEYVLSFEECHDVANRLVWCKPFKAEKTPKSSPPQPASPEGEGLATVEESDEDKPTITITTTTTTTAGEKPLPPPPKVTTIPLRSGRSPTSVEVTFDQLSEPCENTFFDSQYSLCSFDDHEIPVHLLVYRALLQLPLDVRALCMSRIIFTGGGTTVLGLRKRIFDEVCHIVQERGWDPVYGKAKEQLRTNPKLKKRHGRQTTNNSNSSNSNNNNNNTLTTPGGVSPPTAAGGAAGEGGTAAPASGQEEDGIWHDAANSVPEVDPIEAQLARTNPSVNGRKPLQGQLRAIESLGPWAGGSLITHLKVSAVSTIDKDQWTQHGVTGATVRQADVEAKTQQRLSWNAMNRGGREGKEPWTLGVWGAA
ncbi:actin-like ATPase domain-containing protein [Neurospora crassa]|nr:actin-like ATPase domain-containing protein [Neurospora crassa]